MLSQPIRSILGVAQGSGADSAFRPSSAFIRPAAGVSRGEGNALKNRAIVWVCWGEAYVLQARESARTTLSLGIDRLLITDAETARFLAGDKVFTAIIRTEFPHGNNLDKSRVTDLIPGGYDTILYLDTDTRVIGDISLGFDKARLHGIAVVPAPHHNLGDFFGFGQVMALAGVTPAGQMQYNSGVIFCHLSEPARRAMNLWRDLCWNLAKPIGMVNDQPFLSLAFEQLGFQPYVLSPCYNYRALGEHVVGEIRIWHSHHPLPADVNDYAEPWPPRRFLEGVRVPD
jgi:hypothetical protein